MPTSRAAVVALLSVLGAAVVDGQSTVGQYGTAKYQHRCSSGGAGSRCQYTVTLPDCSAEQGEDLCPSPEDQDRAILVNLLDLVNQQTAKLERLSEAVERLSNEADTEAVDRPSNGTDNPCSQPVTHKDCNNFASDGSGTLSSSIYRVKPIGISSPFDVFCEISESEAWTVIQRRVNGLVNFYRNWTEYKSGFGDIDGEYWLGNDNINAITTQAWYRLRIDLEDWDGSTSYAEYDRFWIEDEAGLYTLHLGDYSGTAGDAMTAGSDTNLDGSAFSTYDRTTMLAVTTALSRHKGRGGTTGVSGATLTECTAMGAHLPPFTAA
ncbi:microfibril-associated glycoprotein 4-like [Ptychodera flava]|uniref:microfibril-associated glycoprotein 4-like n=1 Tax=Ptychodera flava TaxID=63121 RepID=UPI00396A3624